MSVSRLVALLERLAQKSSVSRDLQGVQDLQEALKKEMQDLPLRMDTVPCVHREFADLLIGTYAGKEKNFINLIGHADTVLGPTEAHPIRVDEEKNQIIGPGVADDKAGLVIMMEGLRRFFKERPKPRFSYRVISSPSEELGSVSFIPFYKEMARDSVLALGFEPSLEGGHIIHSRRGNRWYDVRIRGRSAHAGRSTKNHLNAIHVAAQKIMQLQKLSNLKKGSSVNVGSIQGGGELYNIICGEANFRLDTRFSNVSEEKRLRKSIQQILLKSPVYSLDGEIKSKIRFDVADDCPSLKASRSSKKFAAQFVRFVEEIEGAPITATSSGGAGDVNHFNRKKGIIILDGLGGVGGKIHTEEEYVFLSSLETRSEALKNLLLYTENKL